MRAAVFARLEEMRFRTTMTVLAAAGLLVITLIAAVSLLISGSRPVPDVPDSQDPFAQPVAPRFPAPSGSRPPEARHPATITHTSQAAAPVVTVTSPPGPSAAAVPSSLTLTATPDPAEPGQPVTYTVMVTPAPVTGTITFTANAIAISGCARVPVLVTGTARCQAGYSRAGSHDIAATYHPETGPAQSIPAVGETIAQCGQHWHGCNLVLADLRHANLRGIDLAGANLQSAELAVASLEDANLAGANLAGADLASADLAGANLNGANLSGITWSDAICPDGTNSDHDGGTCQQNI